MAIDIPKEIEEKIKHIQKDLKDSEEVKLTNEFHITLKFLGEIEENKINDIVNRLKKIKENRFEVEVKSIGVFPNEKYIRVLWLGCYSTNLIRLAKKVRNELNNFGENDEFVPHITIARIKTKPKNNIYNFISKYKNVEIGKFEVKEFKLKKSTLTPSGAIYNDLYVFKL